MSAEQDDTLKSIEQQIKDNPVILYMKGRPDMPQCGFSAQAVQVLAQCGERFAYVDVLANPDIRQKLPQYANWPTFPQLWVKGELVGGSDIMAAAYQSGELQEQIRSAVHGAGDEENDRSRESGSSSTVANG